MKHHVKQVHFVGIGGIGMCGIAALLIDKGYCVTGSDIACTNITRYLLKLGAQKIFLGHQKKNIDKASVIVISSAITADNPEVMAAKEARIPIIRRSEMLSELMRCKYGIAIAGTHGKTTTTAMIISIYIKAGLNPTFINGGVVKSEGVSARLGQSRDLIVEVDESDRSFLCIHPVVEVITNIDSDHMSAYQGKADFLKETFIEFLHNLPFYGYAVVCIDDPVIRSILSNVNRTVITYGFSKDADLCICDYLQYADISKFTVILNYNKKKLKVILNIPGLHNALNATAAMAVALQEGIDQEKILEAMLEFQGTYRRFENLGYYPLNKINGRIGEIILIDDYGHHPVELYATINTVRSGWPGKRLVMIFQPHRFSRTKDLYNEFISVLSDVDVLVLLDVYSAGETIIFGADSQSLCDAISKYGKINPIFVSNIQILLQNLVKILKDNDLILIQGAGTVGEIVRKLLVEHDTSSLI